MLVVVVQPIGQTVRHLMERVVQVDGPENLVFLRDRGVRLVVVLVELVEGVVAASWSGACVDDMARGDEDYFVRHTRKKCLTPCSWGLEPNGAGKCDVLCLHCQHLPSLSSCGDRYLCERNLKKNCKKTRPAPTSPLMPPVGRWPPVLSFLLLLLLRLRRSLPLRLLLWLSDTLAIICSTRYNRFLCSLCDIRIISCIVLSST